MNVLNGFDTGFSFFYTSSRAGTVTIYDGLDGTGTVLGTVAIVSQHDDCGSGDPNGSFSCWAPVGVTFSGTAFSVNFGGVANQTGFDNITLGSDVPEDGGGPPPDIAAPVVSAPAAPDGGVQHYWRNPDQQRSHPGLAG